MILNISFPFDQQGLKVLSVFALKSRLTIRKWICHVRESQVAMNRVHSVATEITSCLCVCLFSEGCNWIRPGILYRETASINSPTSKALILLSPPQILHCFCCTSLEGTMWQTLNGRNPSDTSGLGKCRHRTHCFHYMYRCGSHSCASIQPRVPTHKVTLSFPSTSPIQTPCIEFGCHFYLRNTD